MWDVSSTHAYVYIPSITHKMEKGKEATSKVMFECVLSVLQVAALCTGRAGACVVHVPNS